MYLPRLVMFNSIDKSRLINLSNLRKRVVFLLFLWILILIVGASVNIGVDVLLEQSELKALKEEYNQKTIAVEALKKEYNDLALEYVQDNNIARVVSSVNKWLDSDQINLWITTLKSNGKTILPNLNTSSISKLTLEQNQYSFDPGISLLLSVAALESDFRLFSSSSKDAFGPMQLREITAVHIGIEDRHDPVENMNGGAKYLSYLLQKYHEYPDQLELTLASYNAGTTRVKRDWIGTWGSNWKVIYAGLSSRRRFKETRDYVKTIVAMSRLLASGSWIDMDRFFWSNYRNYIFMNELADIHQYQALDEAAAGGSE